MEQTGLKDKIMQILSSLNKEDTSSFQSAAAQIQQLIVATPIPQEIQEEIIDSYELLGVDDSAGSLISAKDEFVAVRSSATAEDAPMTSFAGQMSSFLNMRGRDAVLQAVHVCWASLFTSKAIYYREKHEFDHGKVLLAVVVQKMVNAEKAGVMLTTNPVNTDQLLIEGMYGLGELRGEVTPDIYTVHRQSRAITTDVKEQRVGIFRSEKGMSEKQPIPQDEQGRQKVQDMDITELARLGMKIEQHYGKPQDIEWCISNGKVYIVQSRPVTTIQQ
jgi:pyruvate,water dikinase